MQSQSDSYKGAGVDITQGYRAVEMIKKHIERTRTDGVLGNFGAFGGMFMPNLTGYERPVLVSGTDGVGTKLKLAFLLDKHDTIGIDAVAMSVNDIICCGAKPLFFLDYIATSKVIPEVIASIVKGVADGCEMASCALIGGETAEMPGFYGENEYDIAGFAVGIVDKNRIIDGSNISVGDCVIGLASSGFHSNGFSLIRQIFNLDGGSDRGFVEQLLTPTIIYVKHILSLIDSGITVGGISNITGGGLYENIPRCLPKGLSAKIRKDSLETPEIFRMLQSKGNIPEHDMYNTFNMGIGMVVVVKEADVEEALKTLHNSGIDARLVGEIVKSDTGVILW